MPSVTVLLPFHRADNLLDEAIESVLDSKNVKVQLLLIDDRKFKVDDKFSRMSKIWTGGVGYANALNEGKSLALGDFVALMNSDDLITNDRFYLQTKLIEESDCDVSVSRLVKINKYGTPVFSLGGNPQIKEAKLLHFLYGSHLANASWMTVNDFWQANMYFENLKLGSDWVLGQHLIKRFRFKQIEKPLYKYRMHQRQITRLEENQAEIIGPIWQELNSVTTGRYVPNSFGLVLAFPNQFKLEDSDVTDSTMLDFDEWSRTLVELASKDELKTLRKRLAFLSYRIWKINSDVRLITPYIKEYLEMYLKDKTNSLSGIKSVSK